MSSILYLYFVPYSFNETYTIESISYQQEQVPNIEFEAKVSNEDDFFKQFSLTQYTTPLLVTTLFNNAISLQINNNNITNYWQLSLSASFDNCIEFYNNVTEFSAGYAKLKIYEYNESLSYREEIIDLSILQTECPSNINIYIEHPTNYNPLLFFNNCSRNISNCTIETIHEIPFMIEWVDNKYSYFFKVHYFYGPARPSSIQYNLPHHVTQPSAIILWLINEPVLLAMCLIFIIFTFCCACIGCYDFEKQSFRYYIIRNNIEYDKKNKKCCGIRYKNRAFDEEYIIDGATLKTSVLDSVIFHHFKKDATKHLMSQTENQQKQEVTLRKLSPFQISIAAMPPTFVIAFTVVYAIVIFWGKIDFKIFHTFNELFFNNSFTAFIAFIAAFVLYSIIVALIYWWFCYRKKLDFFTGEFVPKTETIRSPNSNHDPNNDNNNVLYAGVAIEEEEIEMPELRRRHRS
eukprot:311969_1